MNIKCNKCDTTFEFSNKDSIETNLKFKCSVCGHMWIQELKKPVVLKKISKTISPSYKLLITLNIIIIILAIIGFFLFRENLELIDSYWQNIFSFFDSLIPI